MAEVGEGRMAKIAAMGWLGGRGGRGSGGDMLTECFICKEEKGTEVDLRLFVQHLLNFGANHIFLVGLCRVPLAKPACLSLNA